MKYNTAWYNAEIMPDSMLNSGFKPLKDSDHFAPLQKCMSLVEAETLLDLGCGIAEAAQTFKKLKYTGADLEHIIEHAAKKKNPNETFISFDANKDDFSFIESYDVILMNSFISELPNWYKVLSKVLYYGKKYIILHRQEITDSSNYLEKYITYGGLETVKTIANYEQMKKTFYMNDYNVIYEDYSFSNNRTQKTFLLLKND
jgi:SAM-dependent methyltransferase